MSTIPYDLIPVPRTLRALRFLRLGRMLKLSKMIRLMDVFQEWENSLMIRYATAEVFKALAMTIAVTHWLACIWAYVGNAARMAGRYGWLDSWACTTDDGCPPEFDMDQDLNVYLASLHMACMTMTTVGYGDIGPNSKAEYVTIILTMGSGGIVWAFLLGSITAMLASGNPRHLKYREVMDDINFMIADNRLPSDLAERMREFWRKKQHCVRQVSASMPCLSFKHL